MVSRSYAWLDDSIEHSAEDTARATALAKKWSALETERENRVFTKMADDEAGYYCDDEEDQEYEESKARRKRERLEAQAERDLEIEMIEEKLAAIGARMMRPYEHWNEDERLMQYMERDQY